MTGVPPGPIEFPVVGVLPQWLMFYNDPNDKTAFLRLLEEQYGDIVYWSIMGGKQIYINDSKLGNKLLTNKKFKAVSSQRWNAPNPIPLFTAKDGETNFVNLNGEEWVKRRKLFLSAFNKMLTTKFMNKVSGTAIKNVLIPQINKTCLEDNKQFFPRDIMKYIAFQTVFYANFDRFIDQNDELYVKFQNEIESQLQLAGSDEVLQWMFKKPGTKFPQKYYDARDKLSVIMNEIMDQRRSELKSRGIDYKRPAASDDEKGSNDLSEAIKDLEFDSYLDYLLKLVDEGKIKNSVAEVETLLLFIAGYQNNGSVLEWTLLLFAKYPSIQAQIRNELLAAHNIQNQNGVKEFNLGLISKCPMFRAFIHEVLRISRFAKLTGGRTPTEDTKIEWKGKTYTLPKGTMVSLNLEHMLTKSKNENWKCDANGDITGLHLENFLDQNGKFKMNDSFAVFGYGVRDCPGRAFAVKTIQINAAYVVMNYKIEFGDEDKRKDPQNVEIVIDKSKFNTAILNEIGLTLSPI